jgi:prepilin peptidase CpaA
MGGGDVKLFSALALWCGPSRLASFTLVTSLAGVAVALIMLSPLRRLAPAAPDEARSAARQPMPYGVAIAAGGVWLLAQYLPYFG